MSLEPKLDPHHTKLRVQLAANMIPDRATVSKPTGDKLYTLVRELPVYHEELPRRKITPHRGNLFLVSADALNEISGDKPLHWHTTLDNIQMHCEMA